MNKIVFLFVFLSSFSQAQECLTKSDFVNLERLSFIDANEYLNGLFSSSQLNEFRNTPPECSEEQMLGIFGFNEVGNKGACYFDFSDENSMTMYQVKNYAPIYIYSCDYSCFEDLLNSCRKSLKKNKAGFTETYNVVTYSLGTKSLEFRTYFSDELSYVVLLYNKTQLNKIQLEATKNKIQRNLKEQEEAKRLKALNALCDSLVNNGNILLSQAQYVEAQAQFRKAYSLNPSEEILNLVHKCDELRCNIFIEGGDLLLLQKKYREAIRSYNQAIDCGLDSYDVSEKINKAEKQELTDSIIRLEASANAFFLAREYHKSRLVYNQILSMDSWRYETKKRIGEIDAMLLFLEERKYKVYDYASLNSSCVTSSFSLMENNLTQYIGSTSTGDMRLNIDFKFDTLGRNLSNYKVEGLRVNKFSEQFSEVTNSFQLVPSLKNGYYVNAESQKTYHLSWQTDKATYRYTSNGIKHRFGFKSDYTAITSYLKKNYTYGTYTIESKAIALNQEELRSLKVKSYKANAGPLNVFYSMILPGVGTKRVTYGAQGTGRMITYLISGSLAYGSYYLSGVLTDKYNNAPVGEGQKYQKQAMLSKNAAYAFAGISASIYVYDFFHVLSRGFKNTAKNKRVNQQIMDYSPIKSAPLKLKFN